MREEGARETKGKGQEEKQEERRKGQVKPRGRRKEEDCKNETCRARCSPEKGRARILSNDMKSSSEDSSSSDEEAIGMMDQLRAAMLMGRSLMCPQKIQN